MIKIDQNWSKLLIFADHQYRISSIQKYSRLMYFSLVIPSKLVRFKHLRVSSKPTNWIKIPMIPTWPTWVSGGRFAADPWQLTTRLVHGQALRSTDRSVDIWWLCRQKRKHNWDTFETIVISFLYPFYPFAIRVVVFMPCKLSAIRDHGGQKQLEVVATDPWSSATSENMWSRDGKL